MPISKKGNIMSKFSLSNYKSHEKAALAAITTQLHNAQTYKLAGKNEIQKEHITELQNATQLFFALFSLQNNGFVASNKFETYLLKEIDRNVQNQISTNIESIYKTLYFPKIKNAADLVPLYKAQQTIAEKEFALFQKNRQEGSHKEQLAQAMDHLLNVVSINLETVSSKFLGQYPYLNLTPFLNQLQDTLGEAQLNHKLNRNAFNAALKTEDLLKQFKTADTANFNDLNKEFKHFVNTNIKALINSVSEAPEPLRKTARQSANSIFSATRKLIGYYLLQNDLPIPESIRAEIDKDLLQDSSQILLSEKANISERINFHIRNEVTRLNCGLAGIDSLSRSLKSSLANDVADNLNKGFELFLAKAFPVSQNPDLFKDFNSNFVKLPRGDNSQHTANSSSRRNTRDTNGEERVFRRKFAERRYHAYQKGDYLQKANDSESRSLSL